MNEIQLMKTAGGTPVIDSLTIASGVKVQHKNVLELIRKYPESFQDFGPVAFETRKLNADRGRPEGFALLNEDQAMVLFTFLKNTAEARAGKVKIVKAFKACRDALSEAMKGYQVPQTRAEALRLAADLSDRVDQLETQIKQDAPKVELAEAVEASKSEITITEAAKIFGMKPKDLFMWLRKSGYIYMQGSAPKARCVESGFMTLRLYPYHSSADGSLKESPTGYVTGKGLSHFYRRLRAEGLIERNAQIELQFN